MAAARRRSSTCSRVWCRPTRARSSGPTISASSASSKSAPVSIPRRASGARWRPRAMPSCGRAAASTSPRGPSASCFGPSNSRCPSATSPGASPARRRRSAPPTRRASGPSAWAIASSANGTEWSRRSSTASARSRRVSATSTTRRSHRIRPRCSSGTRRSRPRAPTWTGCTRAGRSWRPSRPDTPEWTRSRGSVKKMRPTRASSWRWVCLAVALTRGVPRAGFAEEPLTAKAPAKTLSWETGEGHSYFIPAFEIAGFIAGLNLFNRFLADTDDYDSDLHSFRKNLTSAQVIDDDPFSINQIGHPYQGSIYYGFARSAGLNYWQALGYSVAGSLVWETAGEKTPPSLNDNIASGIGGSFVGEALFRMASLLLEGGGEKPGFWRELGAAAISPPTGFNRLVFGDRFDAIFPSRSPEIFIRLRLGATLTTDIDAGGLT